MDYRTKIENDDLELEKMRTLTEKKELSKIQYMKRVESHNDITNKAGSFNFACASEFIESDYPQMVVRLIILSTEMKYNNVLMFDRNTYFDGSTQQFMEKLKLKEREAKYTKSFMVENKWITRQEDGKWTVDDRFCFRGSAKEHGMSKLAESTFKVFDSGFEEMYYNCVPSQHKSLFLVLILMKYLHPTCNFLCYNPSEKDPDKVQYIRWQDILNVLNIDTRKKKENFNKLFFGLKTNSRNVVLKCSLINRNGSNAVKDWTQEDLIYINPKVFNKNTSGEQFDSILDNLPAFNSSFPAPGSEIPHISLNDDISRMLRD